MTAMLAQSNSTTKRGPKSAKTKVYILAFRACFLRSAFVCVSAVGGSRACLVSLVGSHARRAGSHAMGSFDNKDPFECFKGDCLRKAWVDDDMGEFLCFVCYLKEENDRAAHSLHAVLSTSRGTAPTPEGTLSFKDLLAVEGLGVKMLEGVFGDGWDCQCPCRHCKREWLNAGWVCPAMYYRREYIYILDARHKAKSDHLYMETEDWDALVLAIHFEYHPPPVIELVASSGSAQPPPAPDSRRHSCSRSRSRSSHRSSVVQPQA